MESTLIILAAGMGSRFGGPKQIEPVGPSGETLLEYGLYDAMTAGFTRFVFVIREAIREDFKKCVMDKFQHKLSCQCALQSMDDLPPSATQEILKDRVKPWGTGHALWAARAFSKGPCAVINADDFYGRQSFVDLHASLRNGVSACLVPFLLRRTLSKQGGVSRGVCEVDDAGYLQSIRECKNLASSEKGRVEGFDNATAEPVTLDPEALVSMNMMGFSEAVWPFLDRHISEFFAQFRAGDTREYGLPDLLNSWMLHDAVTVVPSSEQWLGMTHRSDLDILRADIAKRIELGIYPSNLWD